MANFNSSEISSMISSKKYRIQRGDTLSSLTDKFQGSFASAKCMNKNSLMDKIYNDNKLSFLGNKDLMLEGKDLDLKFVADCRCNLKIDKSKKEYIFTDEDRLVFAIKGQNNFWDDFIKVDRNIGEYFKKTFQQMPSSSLPKSMPLPITSRFSSSGSGREIMKAIGRTLTGAMVTTDQIVEAFYKLMGYNASKSEIQQCACTLEKENGTFRCSANCPCCVEVNKLESLSCKCLEDCYAKTALNSSAINDLKKGFYKVSKLDETMIFINKDLFWKRFEKFISMNKLKEIREAVGYSMNQFHSDELSLKKIFVPIESAWNSISLSFRPSAREVIPSEGKERIKILYLYCNYLGSNFSSVKITSTFRTAERQTEIMIEDYFKKGQWGLYGGSEEIYKNIMSDESLTIEQKDKKAYNDILTNVKAQIKNGNDQKGFPHCNPDICAVDTETWDSNVDKAIIAFRKTGKFLKSTSLHFREKNEKANHLILTGLRPTSTI